MEPHCEHWAGCPYVACAKRDESTISLSRPQSTHILMAANEGFYVEDKSLLTSFLCD